MHYFHANDLLSCDSPSPCSAIPGSLTLISKIVPTDYGTTTRSASGSTLALKVCAGVSISPSTCAGVISLKLSKVYLWVVQMGASQHGRYEGRRLGSTQLL